jgi:hypothetical protein
MGAGCKIPINKGFYIYFSPDGRALSRGREEKDVLRLVWRWLIVNEGHPDHQLVRLWWDQKAAQEQADARTQAAREKRLKAERQIDEHFPNKKWNRKFKQHLRVAWLRYTGIPERDD